MAHIINGDMVTMTLLQGVINAFVIFLSRIIAHVVEVATRRDEEGASRFIYYTVSIICEIVFGLIGTIIVMAYSRRREYAADAGSASYVGRNKMIAALKKLAQIHEGNTAIQQPNSLSALKIDGKDT
jgi:heat shock protein HtpX